MDTDTFWIPFLTTTLIGALGGLIGPFFVWRKLSGLGNALSHASLTPLAVSVYLGIPFGALLVPFSVVLALALGHLEEKGLRENDTLLNIFFVGLFSMGVLMLSKTDISAHEAVESLFGGVSSVTYFDLLWSFLILVLCAGYLVASQRSLLLILFNPDMAQTEGVPVRKHHYVLLVLAALVVSVTLKIMGAVLVTSLLLVPPMVASRLTSTLKQHFVVSLSTGILVAALGFILAVYKELPSGATIATLGLLSVLIVWLIKNK